MLSRRSRILAGSMAMVLACCAVPRAFADPLVESFLNPPDSAKPWIIWQWMNGVVSREGITADLESFKRIGLGGVQNFQIGGQEQARADDPTVQIGNEKWRALMRHAMDECERLGLSFGTHNCPGWTSSSSPEVKVEDSMQNLVWSETKVVGRFSGELPRPGVDPRWDYYRDVAVLAVPDRPVISLDEVVDLTNRMDREGMLRWDAPEGEWSVLRFGHTTNGQMNLAVAPVSGQGLECDKLSRAAVERYWQGYPSMILDLAGPHAGKTFKRFEIDSYEAGGQSWTPDMPAEFKKRRGYDLLPWLPAFAGRTINDKDQTGRFWQDWGRNMNDLFADNYYLFMDELARRTPGMEMLTEPYSTGKGRVDTSAVSGGEAVLACEFWTRPGWGWETPSRVASAAHTWGKPLVVAEAFTCWPLSAWQDDPYALKQPGDRAFAGGVNHMMLHAGAQNPWPDAKPGVSMGIWGTQFVPGQTWWEHGGPEWMAYLSRCQFLLRQGLAVSDICFFTDNKNAPVLPGFTSDDCGERIILQRMEADDGRIVLPDGMSYRVLVLPPGQVMTLDVARKIRRLVNDGAVVIGAKPGWCPGLLDYPDSNAEVAKIGDEVWGDADGKSVTEHRYGKGRVFWGLPVEEVLKEIGVEPDVEFDDSEGILWTHRRVDDADIYFISNQKGNSVAVNASFRVGGRVPELWHADTGRIETAERWSAADGRTGVALDLDPSGSMFVVFRKPADGSGPGLERNPPPRITTVDVEGPWELRFPAGGGAPEKVTLDRLLSWPDHPDAGVRYFSGTAVYRTSIVLPDGMPASGVPVDLDLGVVKNVAEVRINGKNCGTLWKPPFRIDVAHALKPGRNTLEIHVTNLWPNRMIGDEQLPDDCEWSEPIRFHHAPRKPVVGRFLTEIPEWLSGNKPRPSKGRHTFVTFKFFTKDSPLLPSGLIGPVRLGFPDDATGGENVSPR